MGDGGENGRVQAALCAALGMYGAPGDGIIDQKEQHKSGPGQHGQLLQPGHKLADRQVLFLHGHKGPGRQQRAGLEGGEHHHHGPQRRRQHNARCRGAAALSGGRAANDDDGENGGTPSGDNFRL